MRKIGCLVILAVGVAAGWLLRDRIFGSARPSAERSAPTAQWERLTPEGAARMRASLQSLQNPFGPVSVTVSPGDLASYVLEQLRRQLPPSADSIEAGAFGDRLYVRAVIKPTDFGGIDALGPIASFLGDREEMQFGGGFEILRPGLAQFRVQEIRLRDFPIPPRAIPRLLRSVARGTRPEGLSDDGLPLVVPQYVGDVRIEPGKVTLYKRAP